VAKLPQSTKLPKGDEIAQLGVPGPVEIDVALLFKAPPKDPPAVDSMEDLLAKTPQVAASDLLASRQARRDTTKSLFALIRDDPTHPMFKATEEELQRQEAEVAKLLKATPSAQVQIEQLKTARQSQIQARTAWEQKAVVGKEKAAARRQRQVEYIDKVIAELAARKVAISEQAVLNERAWAAFHTSRATSWNALIAKFDGKVAELEMALRQAPPPSNTPAYALPPQAEQVLALTVVDPVAVARQDAAQAQQAVAAAHCARQLAIAAAAASPAHLASVSLADDDILVALPDPSAQQLQELHTLWGALSCLSRHEARTGWIIPVSFEELQVSPDIGKYLVGQKVWAKLFASDPTPKSVVTVQLRNLMQLGMNGLRDKVLEAQNQAQPAAVVEQKMDDVVSAYRAKRPRQDDAGSVATGA